MTLKIMPLGDSITHGWITNLDTGSGGYRVSLWNSLRNGGYDVDLVGTRSTGPSTIDRDHEGYPGYRIDQVAAIVDNLLVANQPDVVLLMLGTNDLLQDRSVGNAPNRLAGLIDQIYTQQPDVQILVASLPPLNYSSNDTQQVIDFNSLLPDIVESRFAQGRNIHLVDINRSMGVTDLADKIHPTASGYVKIANTWYDAIRSLVDFRSDRFDFNGDRNPDILWRNPTTGENQIWQMDRFSVTTMVPLPAVEDLNWTIAPIVDGNRDGNPDLVWYNSATGESKIWQMNGTAISTKISFPVMSGNNWAIQAITDLTQDGNPDFIWRNARTGENLIWHMNGTSVSTSVPLPIMEPSQWTISGQNDFDQNGNPDILWHNTSNGQTILWQMDGVTLSTAIELPGMEDSNWTIESSVDLNRDGSPDLLWHNSSTGENLMWQMSRISLTTTIPLPSMEDSNWTIEGMVDLNRDGNPDFIWHNLSTGENLAWQMNRTSLVTAFSLPSLEVPEWQIEGLQ
ncbi:GDSL-type esterase/lipase family protein [Kovacikia minuta CCNUW1]|uniref:FG-GAP-like repeat-containing protein n=1 Tax=Kovacikia minuta TaxID=2931930 RepID=UPI001CCC4B6D|nr:FG-GAP-like repeat-containing protein [Kovacikia minuta]UBF25153.1 GDSL-type esterase/lipase family protein [Kovacikia minuta CCNUW1]